MNNEPVSPIEVVWLMSIVKPILFVILIGIWGWVAGFFDKDLMKYFFPRQLWNGAQVGAAALSAFLIIFIPIFWIGFPLGVAIIFGTLYAYVHFRNARVPEKAKWDVLILWKQFQEKLSNVKREQNLRAATVRIIQGGKPQVPPAPDHPLFAAHNALEIAMEFAIQRKAYCVELTVEPSQASINVQIDGIKYMQPPVSPQTGIELAKYLKLHGNLDVNDNRKKQTGSITIDTDFAGQQTISITTAGSTRGMFLIMFIDVKKAMQIKFDDLGFVEQQRAQITKALEKEGGVSLVGSPPGNGQTTTMYSMIGRHDPYTTTIFTLEDEVLFDLEGVVHTKVDLGGDIAGVTSKLKQQMLRETQIVMLSRIPDNSIGAMIASYSHQTRFYIGMQADDSFGMIKQYCKLVGDQEAAAKSLSVIICQRLVRKLCTTCRISYQPDADALRKLNLPANKVNQLYKHSGQVIVGNKPIICPDCMGLGYRGRVGVYEVVVIDDEARALIISNQFEQLRAHVRKNKTMWLQEAALTKAVEGVTSIAEITRALSKDPNKDIVRDNSAKQAAEAAAAAGAA
jgi:type II secretory ATPase GspE/PulE/Tfp pilus assembly ATPase PilB-like protein